MPLDEDPPDALHIDGCPNSDEAGQRVRSALDATGRREVVLNCMLIRTSDDAKRVPFAGSPSISINGVDVFPGGSRASDLRLDPPIEAQPEHSENEHSHRRRGMEPWLTSQ